MTRDAVALGGACGNDDLNRLLWLFCCINDGARAEVLLEFLGVSPIVTL